MTHHYGFQPMVEIIPAGEATDGKRKVVVEHFSIEKADARWFLRPDEYIMPGRYVRLMVNGGVMMSDTQWEQRTNYSVIRHSRGDVLIAGLGIGMVLVPILKKSDVSTVTVIERDPLVIQLIAEHVKHSKLRIIQADIMQWSPERSGRQFDTIYFDIWQNQSTDDLETMKTLHLRFRRYMRVGAWMSSWRHKELQDRKRRGGQW